MARSTSPLPMDPIAEARRQWQRHGWVGSADGMAAVTSIMRAQQLMLARVESVLKPHGLSFARYEMLTLLSFTKDGVLPMASATARLQVHPTSVTNTVDRLERDGLVARSSHPTDGRAALLTLSDKGRAVASKASADLNSVVFDRPGLDDDDLSTLVRILGKFRRDAGDFVVADVPAESL